MCPNPLGTLYFTENVAHALTVMESSTDKLLVAHSILLLLHDDNLWGAEGLLNRDSNLIPIMHRICHMNILPVAAQDNALCKHHEVLALSILEMWSFRSTFVDSDRVRSNGPLSLRNVVSTIGRPCWMP